ncbi:adenylyl-sulfate kinase [Dyadobacter psychrotolerans]|uniref:Adenylyl-sulfate kinase n=1 Tax=Dyadobacter psychrotolerans TaxID=2541721 RepID=A0A4R5DPH8_9BACT|nr:adenylyl-sulfate kinase [Dyadobacter psychrotolerans]TDE16232.1 adenylyl-sulfate kinase [Dyadobacter psychrotolerans]
MIIQFCGLSGAGKTTLATGVKNQLSEKGVRVEIIDGDLYRSKLGKDLGFSKADRQENIRRLGFLASRFSAHGIVSIMSVINPYEEIRTELVNSYENVKTIYLDCSLETLFQRDTKGLYKRTLLPEDHPDKLKNLTGVNDQFDRPDCPDLYINTGLKTISECTDDIAGFVLQNLDSDFPLRSETMHFKGLSNE